MTSLARLTATIGVVLLVCGAQSSTAQEPRPEPPPAAGMPARYGRQVAPTPSSYWRAPNLGNYADVLKTPEASRIDPDKRYELPELIDLAQRTNPETRVAWEGARRAALAVGLVESEYFPVLAISVLGGYQNLAVPVPTSVASDGFFRLELLQAVPALNLRWLLLDFGRRGNARDAAKERLMAANLGFNRQHQQVAFAVQRAFYGMTSIRARIAVAQSSLDAARTVQEATESRLTRGLATRPEVALARQQAAQAMFDLEDVLAKERDAQVTLAESIGITPTTPIQVTEFSNLPAGTDLQESVEKTIDRALEKRPDLLARVAALRASEADVRRARAAYWPTLSLVGDVGSILGNARITADDKSTKWFGATQPSYGIGLSLAWEVFDGGARQRRVELAESTRRTAEDQITATRDRAVSEVWKAYTDVKLAYRRLDVAAALLEASQLAYDDSLATYRMGLGTLTDLLAARRELSRARFVELDTKVQLLQSAAALAFNTGESPVPDR
ncbi:MAG TPA: TolC family protein [Methylomirabilota bacterium]|nr:TolC family protein [Methylomirabilota bacterium]